MSLQHCPRCSQDLPLDAFPERYRGKRGNYCILCAREYMREYTRTHRPAKRPASKRTYSTKYGAIHMRLTRQRGPASNHPCALCGRTARDWAYDHNDQNEITTEWYGYTVAYSTDLDHYRPLCKPCHLRFDKGAATRAVFHAA